MPANPTNVTRKDDPAGDSFKTYDDPSNNKVQGVANDPEVMGRVLSWAATPGSPATSLLASNTPGALFRADVVTVDPPTVANMWLMVFDSASVPAAGAVPALRARVIDGEASLPLGMYGREMTAGIAVGLSTTPGTFTAAAAEGFFQVAFV